jgi:titin
VIKLIAFSLQGSRFREGLDFGFVSLDIMHVYAEDAGTYTCRATNVLGQAVNSADLIVRAKETIVKDTIHKAAIEQVSNTGFIWVPRHLPQ